MNVQFAKELKEKLGIGLSEALALIKEYGVDFERCQKAVYDNQIAQIMTQTECNQEEAEICLKRFANAEKAINYLKNKVFIFSVNGLASDEPYGFYLYAVDENKAVLPGKYAHIFVPFSHFEQYVQDSFAAVFPIDGYYDEYNRFDLTGINYFGKKEVQTIIQSLKTKIFHHENEQIFVLKLIDWLTEKIEFSDKIAVDGTL